MDLRQIGIVSETAQLRFGEVARRAAGLQRQVQRDFRRHWEVDAIVSPFERLEDVPIGYWPVIVRDDIQQNGAAGIHIDKDGQPFALVTFGPNWTLTTSHEILEMLADPWGNRVKPGQSMMQGQGRVEYLVEVCDPSEGADYAYVVDDVLVSDFYTPSYFDPVASAGVQYSFTGAIKKPMEVLPGGYLSWHDQVSDHWFQLLWFGGQPEFRDLGVLRQADFGSCRAMIDALTPRQEYASFARPETASVVAAAARTSLYAQSTGAHASRLRGEINGLLARSPQASPGYGGLASPQAPANLPRPPSPQAGFAASFGPGAVAEAGRTMPAGWIGSGYLPPSVPAPVAAGAAPVGTMYPSPASMEYHPRATAGAQPGQPNPGTWDPSWR